MFALDSIPSSRKHRDEGFFKVLRITLGTVYCYILSYLNWISNLSSYYEFSLSLIPFAQIKCIVNDFKCKIIGFYIDIYTLYVCTHIHIQRHILCTDLLALISLLLSISVSGVI